MFVPFIEFHHPAICLLNHIVANAVSFSLSLIFLLSLVYCTCDNVQHPPLYVVLEHRAAIVIASSHVAHPMWTLEPCGW